MKKFAFLLLALLLFATCFVFVGCDKGSECLDGYNHRFQNGSNYCVWCDKSYCDVYEHSFTTSPDGESVYCKRCGVSKSVEKEEESKTILGTFIMPEDTGWFILTNVVLLAVGLLLRFAGGDGYGIFTKLLIYGPRGIFIILAICSWASGSILGGIIATVFTAMYYYGDFRISEYFV